ncbi:MULTISPECIES: Asp23/Gls24 family envelope stress response protein [unclassified Streptomyces]|uniref:Asp23/Gls24 family envelope stress response protein n=1 Tax=unclassified Streptomyces TaxID=2593676 RepID=UPI0027424E28|nr:MULTISPECIES: Asp23/Gls24 family envelope stress response protein [unclassified Streptomyces]
MSGSSTGSAVNAELDRPALSEGPGRTVVAERVVEKIAALAVREAGRVGGVAPRLLGMPLGREGMERTSHVTAWVGGQATSLSVTVSLAWPCPARATTRRLRQHIIERVEYLTGLRVDHVDIDVTHLPSPSHPTRRVR